MSAFAPISENPAAEIYLARGLHRAGFVRADVSHVMQGDSRYSLREITRLVVKQTSRATSRRRRRTGVEMHSIKMRKHS